MAAARHRNDTPDESTPICEYHGQFVSDLQWLRWSGKWVLTLVGVSAITLVGIFGTMVKFGWEMSVSGQLMQKELIRIAGEVNELKEADKKICAEMKDLKRRNGVNAGVKADREPWAE